MVGARRGFTLVELLAALAIVAVLLAVAAPRYFQGEQAAREKALVENLRRMREAIQQYHADKGRYPERLETLAQEKYLRSIPVDPVTESAATWIVVPPSPPERGGVYDVRSGAHGVASTGARMSDL